jgi:tRNA1Val (adenine37-N6)-methyltransferase
MRFADAELTRDAFLDGRLHLRQPRRGYRAATDPVLLAAFTPVRPGERVLELGCGAGAAALCLAVRVPGLDLHGLELQAAYAELARRNAAENGLALHVHEGDLRRPPAALRRGFDHVLANPPFHPATSASSPDPGRDRAHREGEATLADWIEAGLRRLVPGGRLVIVHRTARLGTILAALEGRAGAAEVLPIASRASRPAARVLVRARKARAAPLTLWPPLTFHEGDAHAADAESYTVEAQRVLRGAAALLPDARVSGSTPP